MPKTTIREKDYTGNETLTYLDFTVLVPSIELSFTAGTGSKINKVSGLFTTYDDFVKTIKTAMKDANATDAYFKNDPGFIFASTVLKNGLSIYYAPAYTNDGRPTYQDIDAFFDEFSDKGKYDLRFITTGGIPESSIESAISAAIKCAGKRGDCAAIASVPEKGIISIESGESGQEIPLNNSFLIDQWVNNMFGVLCETPIGRKGVSWTDTEETYGRYAAMFTPWCTIPYNDTEFKYKADSISIAPGLNYLACFGKYVSNYPEWKPTAGSIRGVSPFSKLEPKVIFGDADIDLLQVRSDEENKGHVATNVICNIPPFGKIIWGCRTMHPLSVPAHAEASDDAGVQLVASSFLNIRMLCSTLKKTLYRAARRFTFEPNSDVLWFNFVGAITPTLEKMKANEGVRGYQIVKQKTNKKALLSAVIKISPVDPVEDFDLTVELRDTIDAVSVSEEA